MIDRQADRQTIDRQVQVSISCLHSISQILSHIILCQTRRPSLQHRRCSNKPMTTVVTYLIIRHATQKLPSWESIGTAQKYSYSTRDITLWGWGDIFKNTEYALNQRPQDPKRYWGTMSPKRRLHVLGKQGVEAGLPPLTIIPNDILEDCTSCLTTLCSAELKVLVPKRVHWVICCSCHLGTLGSLCPWTNGKKSFKGELTHKQWRSSLLGLATIWC